MTTVWICQPKGGEMTAHDTESEAESRARELVASKAVTHAVAYPVDVEPVVRVGYWDRTRERAA